MNKKLAIVVVILLLLSGGAGWWWHNYRADRLINDGQLHLQGNVDIRQVSLAFNATERIAQLLAREGDRVTAGQVLGRLDTRTARVSLAQADARIGSAEQVLERLRAGSRPEEVAQARANVAAAQADLRIAQLQVNRLRGVRDETAGRGISQQDLDNALSREQVANARLQAASQSSKLIVLGPRREDIAQAASQLDAARADRAMVMRQIEEAELHAPIDAVVRSRLLEPGDMASPARPVYTLAITQPKWVRAYVAEGDLARVQAGMPASVTIDSAKDRSLPGKVGFIGSVAEFTPKSVQTEELRTSLVYEIRVFVDDPSDLLRLGMPATVHLRPDASH